MRALEEKYDQDSEAAKVYCNKLLCHYAKVLLMKDERVKNHHPGLTIFQDLSSWYTAQVHT